MKRVNGHPGYTVSSDGLVLGPRGPVRQYLCSGGYPTVSIGGKYRGIRVHRLVAEAFLPGYRAELYVNHIDGDKRNNNVTNLEMVTNEENLKHAWRTGLCSPKHGEAKAAEVRRLAVLRLGQKEIASITGTSVSWVDAVLNGHVSRYGSRLADRRTSGKDADTILAIYKLAEAGATLKEIAAEHKISKSQAWNIVNGISYPELYAEAGPSRLQRKMKPRKDV